MNPVTLSRCKTSLLAAALGASLGMLPSAQAATLSDDKIRIGVLGDMSSVYADVCGPGCVTAVQMAVEDFGGQIDGKPIEVVSADDQNKPDVGSAIVRKWVDSEQVDMVTGLVASSVTGAVTNILGDAGKIALIAGSGSNAFTTSACSPYNVHWTYDVVALAQGTVKPMVQAGKKNWFFITADYAFGHALEKVATGVIEANGGQVLGAVKVPLGTTDFSSYILQAQSSGADVVAMANAGGDFVNALKNAAEFGLTDMMDVAGLLVLTQSVQALDPDVAGGLKLTTGFYWDLDDASRDWSARFKARHGGIPSMIHAGIYSATLHYLNSIAASGSDEGKVVMKHMKDTRPNDFFARNAVLRADGRMVHDMYHVRIKPAEERRHDDDIFEIVEVIPGDQAYAAMQPQCDFK